MLCKCGMPIAQGRLDLGLNYCLECGAKQADEERLEKSKRTAIAYNKGPIMYMGSQDVAKANLQGTMNAQGRSIATLSSGSIFDGLSVGERITGTFKGMGTVTGRLKPAGPEMQELKSRRKKIGIAYLANGDSQYVYSHFDPVLKTAVRKVFFKDGR